MWLWFPESQTHVCHTRNPWRGYTKTRKTRCSEWQKDSVSHYWQSPPFWTDDSQTCWVTTKGSVFPACGDLLSRLQMENIVKVFLKTHFWWRVFFFCVAAEFVWSELKFMTIYVFSVHSLELGQRPRDRLYCLKKKSFIFPFLMYLRYILKVEFWLVLGFFCDMTFLWRCSVSSLYRSLDWLA